MATITHIIRSCYDPADRDKLERETGQQTNNQSDPWQTESSFSAQRRIRTAPTFVPATISCDEWGVPLRSAPPVVVSEQPDQSSTSTAEWYKSLTSSSSRVTSVAPSSFPSAPSPCQGSRDPESAQTHHRESITKNNWFISKALCSAPSTKPSSPAPSLADLLARDPPPLPSEGRYTPPVWLHIGPSNRGFGMLQRSGWEEGEGLGAHAMQPRSYVPSRDSDERPPSSVKMLEGTRRVIDLTQSDSDASEDGVFEDHHFIQRSVQAQAPKEASASHTQRSLLTPLPTILKADRLGIGLKAKTEGPYKQSKKRVTHSAAALAAHVRSAEEMRRKRATFGKGTRGFTKAHQREEDKRKSMLAYLNER